MARNQEKGGGLLAGAGAGAGAGDAEAMPLPGFVVTDLLLLAERGSAD
ncbi:hypothetical protein V1634_35015 [Plantactinospora veratri]|uniref:Uncharacterized protein n=1 Tax=Plantactinospora veratri TaxID=1436122 RepID=A0ABU7SPZ7_9ACTN